MAGTLARRALGWLFAIAAILFAIAAPASAAERRIALLIGNGGYADAVGRLRNPSNDVAAIRDALQSAGFAAADIEVRSDLGLVAFKRTIDAFAARAATLTAGDVVFLYYSGHGAARASTGENFLIPTDAARADTDDLWYQSVKLDEVVTTLRRASRAATFVVVDACRNELKLARNGKDVSGAAGKSFGAVPAEAGMLIAFAADQGQIAREGATSVSGGLVSPYAAALAKTLTTPGLTATAAFQAVRPRVLEWTAGAQEPVFTSKLNRDPVFVVGPSASADASTIAQQQRELARLRAEIEALRQASLQTKPAASGAAPCTANNVLLFFDWDKANVSPEAITTLEAALARSQTCKIAEIKVAGQPDGAGSPAYARALAERRAMAVRDLLVARGASAGQIEVSTLQAGPTPAGANGVRDPAKRVVNVTFLYR